MSGSKDAEIRLVEHGIPRARIFLGERATEMEEYAARELQRYLREMSGAVLEIAACRSIEGEWTKARDRGDHAILIGRPQTHSKIKELCDNGLVNLSDTYPGSDGFVLQTVPDHTVDGRHCLVLGGSMDRATLYAVYHFLEHVCKCGFFEDGDYVPRKETIGIPALDRVERPCFPNRKNIQACALAYSMAHWEWEDWKKELDWMAKKKFNTAFYPSFLLDASKREHPAWQRTWRVLGLKEQGEADTQSVGFRLSKRIIAYARKLGMKVLSPGFNGSVPAEFRKVYPRGHYLEVKWEAAPATLNLHPDDPMFAKVLSVFIGEYTKLFGTDHLYDMAPYAEVTPENTPEKNRQIKVDFARAVIKGMTEADAEGIWYMSGWAFYAPPWSEEEVRDFLAVIPDDRYYVCDTWSDEKPIYKNLNYFYGKTWGFSILHAFGGNTALHGDLKDLIKRVKDVTTDPEAIHCKWFYLNPEIIGHNFLYYDLATQLAWDPRGVDLDSFLRAYAIRRYGEASAENMLKALEELAQSVYSINEEHNENVDLTSPQYQVPIGVYTEESGPGTAGEIHREKLEKRFSFIPHLRHALEFALREEERQRENPLYQIDVLDMLRQYLGELFNIHFVRFNRAFREGHEEELDKEASALEALLNHQALLLSTHKDYRLSTEIEQAKRRPGADDHVDRAIKARVSYLGLTVGCSWEEEPLFLLDYARKDLFELIKCYYHPRVTCYVQAARKALQQGCRTLPRETLKKEFMDIARRFIYEPLEISEEEGYKGTTLQAAKEIFAQTSMNTRITHPPAG